MSNTNNETNTNNNDYDQDITAEQRLIVSIIRKGIEEQGRKYIVTPNGKYYLSLLNIEPEVAVRYAKRLAERERYGFDE